MKRPTKDRDNDTKNTATPRAKTVTIWVKQRMLKAKRWVIAHPLGALCGAIMLIGAVSMAWLITPYQPTLAENEPSFYTLSEQEKGAWRARAEYLRGTFIRQDSESKATVRLHDGYQSGQEVQVTGSFYTRYHAGDSVIVQRTSSKDFLYDHWRLPAMILAALVFIGIVLLVAGKRGVRSLLGLGGTIIVVAGVINAILQGANGLLAGTIGALVIAIMTLLISHGWTRQAWIAICSMVVCIIVAAFASWQMTALFHTQGLFDETNVMLAQQHHVAIQAIIAGGVVLVTAGALDDIIVTQMSVVQSLRRTKQFAGAKVWPLYREAMNIGRDHIGAIINTLVLSYVGAGLPFLMAILLVMQQNQQTGVAGGILLMNSEIIALEFVRTGVSSAILLLSVPLATYLAARYLRPSDGASHGHGHAVGQDKQQGDAA
ncbi:YibE/F family protein [Candidatus Saccharibacteria bacterium]|nr:YibE/F family protein [Candidatus Saccharibacteria bacterium]